MKILCLSGSLRANSSTQIVLNQITSTTSDDTEFVVYDNLGKLPHFNDSQEVPEAVANFRKALADADGVLIVTPEYAFGVPGTLKNALDWVVSSGELVNKPTAVIVASTGGENAMHALLLTLKAISANIGEKSTLLVPFIRSKINGREVIDAKVKTSLEETVNDIAEKIRKMEK